MRIKSYYLVTHRREDGSICLAPSSPAPIDCVSIQVQGPRGIEVLLLSREVARDIHRELGVILNAGAGVKE